MKASQRTPCAACGEWIEAGQPMTIWGMPAIELRWAAHDQPQCAQSFTRLCLAAMEICFTHALMQLAVELGEVERPEVMDEEAARAIGEVVNKQLAVIARKFGPAWRRSMEDYLERFHANRPKIVIAPPGLRVAKGS